jgi:hypothetical protein
MECIFLMFLDHTQWRTTVCRTPLDERSARHRDLYLTTHDTHNKYPCPRWESNPGSQQVSGLRLLTCWDRGFDSHRGHGLFVCCECHVLSGRGLCDELIARPEESYRLWCIVVCDLETSRICTPYIYDIGSLRVNDLSLILLTWSKWWANNASI